MPESLSRQAQAAVGDVVEGTCPLCKVSLRIHDDRACCPCCGDSYRAGRNRLEVRRCAAHGRTCQHWEAVWASRPVCNYGSLNERSGRSTKYATRSS